MQPKCSQVCKFVKELRPDLLGVCTAGIEAPCKLVEVGAHLAALGKQGGNSGQGFFSAASNDNSALDLCTVQRTADVGEKVMDRLRKVDQVAYVRFASVYRQFKDIDTFMAELNKLLAEK